MKQAPAKSPLKAYIVFLVFGLLLAAAGAGGWFYYSSRVGDVPPFPPQQIRAVAKLTPAPRVPIALPVDTNTERPQSANQVPERQPFHVEFDPLREFHDDLKNALLRELGPSFPELRVALDVDSPSIDPAYRHIVFQLLDAADKAGADQRPALLLAADLVAKEIWCDMDNKADCDQLRRDFARYGLNLQGARLGGVYVYSHDLIWRLLRDYSETEWGERAFVLLLERGWDTSPTCEKGGDQSTEVIRQGEEFLKKRPKSRYREIVTLLLGDAYALSWSLTNEQTAMSGGLNPSQLKQDGEAARVRAIGYFEDVVKLAPDTGLGEYARQMLPHLAAKETMDLDNARFFCIYD